MHGTKGDLRSAGHLRDIDQWRRRDCYFTFPVDKCWRHGIKSQRLHGRHLIDLRPGAGPANPVIKSQPPAVGRRRATGKRPGSRNDLRAGSTGKSPGFDVCTFALPPLSCFRVRISSGRANSGGCPSGNSMVSAPGQGRGSNTQPGCAAAALWKFAPLEELVVLIN